MAVPVQEFQIGQRVRFDGRPPFVITAVCLHEERFCYSEDMDLDTWHFSSDLTLCPERPPYVPSERRVVVTDCDHTTRIAYYQRYCRCETDAELAARHAAERAEYDAQGDEA